MPEEFVHQDSYTNSLIKLATSDLPRCSYDAKNAFKQMILQPEAVAT